MPAPMGVLCDLCGKKFFKHSLPIHRKKCVVMREKAFTDCPKCQRRIGNDEYAEHVSLCTTIRKKLPPKKTRVIERAKVQERKIARKKKDEESSEEDSSEEETSSDEEDARQQCGFCLRKFNPDRIGKHEQICAANHSKKPRKQFKTAADARLAGTDFEKYKDCRREVEKPASRWRSEHLKLVDMVEQSRLLEEFKNADIPLTQLPPPGTDLKQLIDGNQGSSNAKNPENEKPPPGMERCPHCKRTFNESAAAKHIPKCKTTINKPKRLVRKSKVVLEKPRKDFTEKIKEAVLKVMASKTKKNSYFETKEASQFRVGEEITLADGREGEIRFIGRINELFPGYWVGIEIQKGKGINDGSVEGNKLFTCEPGKGLFVRPSKLKKKPLKLSDIKKNSKTEKTPTKKQLKNSDENLSTSKTEKKAGTESKASKTVTKENETPKTKVEIRRKNPSNNTESQGPKINKLKLSKSRPSARSEKETEQQPEQNKSEKRTKGQRNTKSQAKREEDTPRRKLKRENLKKKESMVEKLRKEVRTNSPRSNQEDDKVNAPLKRNQQSKHAREKNKRVEKNVKLLQALHGDTSNLQTPNPPSISNPAATGKGQTLGGGQRKPGGNNPAAARAAYFDRLFAEKKKTTEATV